MVEDGGIIVLGGLISDEVRESKSQVPFLGSIPIIGELFKTRSVDKVKTQPDGLHPPAHPARRRPMRRSRPTRSTTTSATSRLASATRARVPLMPGERQPTLPALEQLVPPELLNPARQAAPPGATPAERAQATGQRVRRSATPAGMTQPPATDAAVRRRRHRRRPRRQPTTPSGEPHARDSPQVEPRREQRRHRSSHPRCRGPGHRPAAPAAVRVCETARRAGARGGRRRVADVVVRDGASPLALAEVRRHLRRPLELERVTVERFETSCCAKPTKPAPARRWTRWAASRKRRDLAHLAQDIPEPSDLLESEDEAPVIRLINALLTQAVKENASDIHVEPFENRLVIRFRVDGVLREVLQTKRAVAPLIVSRIKVMSRLDIAEKRLPQDGRISLRIAGRAVDVRVSTIPAGHGERVVLRLLDKQAGRLDLHSLGMDPVTQHACRRTDPQAERHPARHRARPAPARPRRCTPRSIASTTARATS